MIKKIYICDKCGLETELSDHIYWIKLFDYTDKDSYIKMICVECYYNIKKLIDNNYMVLDPEELRK